MILAITGMEVHPFDRLARAVDRLADSGEDVFIQLGACTYEPRNAGFERFLSFDVLCRLIVSASAVITHAGVGSTLTCIQQGKVPIIVPRRAQFGEHVDDHQLPFAAKIAATGHAIEAADLRQLPNAVHRAKSLVSGYEECATPSPISDWLEAFWAESHLRQCRPPRLTGLRFGRPKTRQ